MTPLAPLPSARRSRIVAGEEPEERSIAPAPPEPLASAAQPLWRRLTAAVEAPHVWAVSFDCFDTLLFRDVPRPVDLFPRVGVRLAAAGQLPAWVSPPRFQALRIAAEAEARVRRHAQGGGREIALADIYAAFPERALAREAREAAAALELAVERESLRPFPLMVALAERVRALGKTLAVCSDTYVPSDWLFDTLSATAGVAPDLLLCSNAYGKGKMEGLLAVLPARLGLKPEAIVHIGDNYEADVAAAQAAGLTGIHVCHGTSELWRTFDQEHRLDQVDPAEAVDPVHGDLGLQSVRAKCAALSVGTPLAGFWHFGATVLGPAMTMFGEWLGARVRAFEADALLCVMREGPFLGRLARTHLESDGIALVDVWLSRRVLRYASLVRLDADALRGLCGQMHSPTLRQVCEDLGIAPDELPADLGLAAADPLDAAALGRVLARVAAMPALAQAILTRAAALRQAVVAHLFRQLGEAGRPRAGGGEQTRRPLRLALVDVGWQGQIQRMLGDILAAENVAVEIAGFYVGTAAPAGDSGALAQRMEGFLFDFGRPALPCGRLMRAVEILEQCLSCESGSSISLSHDGRPLVAPDLIPLAQRGQIRQVQAGILAFQALWRDAGGRVADPAAPWIADIVRRHVLRALIQPSEEEAAMLASWSHDDNLVDGRVDTILPDRVRSHARHMSVGQLLAVPATQAYWSYGLAAQTSPQARALVRAAMDGMAEPAAFERPLNQTAGLYWSRDGAYSEAWSARMPLVANHEGRSYVRLSTGRLTDGGLRFLRFDPLALPSCLQVDFLELTVHFAEPCPSVRLSLRDGDLAACARSGVWPLGGSCFATGRTPQIHIDLHALGVWAVAAVDLHAGLGVTALGGAEDAPPVLPPDALSAAVPAALAGKPLHAGVGAVDAIRGSDPSAAGRAEVACGSPRPLAVTGWTADASGRVLRRAAHLMLRRSDGTAHFVPASRTQRFDVAQALGTGDALFAGMEAVFAPAALPPGTYALIWAQAGDEAGSLAETGATLVVR